jgi:hypothetical protein
MQARRLQQASDPDLPFQVLVQILAYVPVEHRLSSCATVCKSWAAAAAAATIDIVICDDSFSAEATQSLSNWLEQHPSDVVSIRVPDEACGDDLYFNPLYPLALPCAHFAA